LPKHIDPKSMSFHQAKRVQKAVVERIKDLAKFIQPTLPDDPDSSYSRWCKSEETRLYGRLKRTQRYTLGVDMNVIERTVKCPFDIVKARNTVTLALRLNGNESMSQLRRLRFRLIAIAGWVKTLEEKTNPVHCWDMHK